MSEQTTQQPEKTQPASISVEDLRFAALLIDRGIEQGAYRSWEEIQHAWNVRSKFAEIVQAHDQHVAAQKEQEETKKEEE
jgi:hypothetical protein